MAIYQSQFSGKEIDNAVRGTITLTNYNQALTSDGILDTSKLKLLGDKILGAVASAQYATTATSAETANSAQTSTIAQFANVAQLLTIQIAKNETQLLSFISKAEIGQFIRLSTTNSLYVKVTSGSNLSCCVQVCSGLGTPTATPDPIVSDRYNVSISCLTGDAYALSSDKKAISLTITLPTASEMLLNETITSLAFSTHDSITPTLTINGGTIVFKGEDVTSGVFSPQANATYEISIWYNGSLWVGSAVKWA